MSIQTNLMTKKKKRNFPDIFLIQVHCSWDDVSQQRRWEVIVYRLNKLLIPRTAVIGTSETHIGFRMLAQWLLFDSVKYSVKRWLETRFWDHEYVMKK